MIEIGFGKYKYRIKTLKTTIADIEAITGYKVDIVRRFFMYVGRGIYYLFLPIVYSFKFLGMILEECKRTPEEWERLKQERLNTFLLELAIEKVFRQDYQTEEEYRNAVVLKALEIERQIFGQDINKGTHLPSEFGALMDLLGAMFYAGKIIFPIK